MKLRAIRLHNVRRFTDRGIAIEGIDDGVNVLAESNEYGKSTVFDAVHALFFQPHKGKPKPIQLLQPYSKGAITVEAEIDTPDGVFRLRKRWYGSALAQVSDTNGRIIAQADEADRWIDARMRGGATGPAGLLWVQQGVVEMGQGTKTVADAEKAAREDVLSSVSGEIETLTGGRRTTQVLAKCTDELNAYVTATGKPKTGGAYAAALAERDTLTANAEEMTLRVTGLRGDLDRRATARKRLAELRDADTLARDTKALADAEAALKQAEDQAARLEKATLTETLAKQEYDAGDEALIRFDAVVEAIEKLTQRVATEQAQHAQSTDARAKAEAALTEATTAVADQRTALQATEAALNTARAATLAKAAASRLTEWRKTLADADEAGRAAETERAAANALALPDARVKALENQEDTIATLTAELRASSISVRVSYANPTSGAIRRDGVSLNHGDAVSVDQTVRFEIDGIGALTVAPGAGDRTTGLAEKLRAAIEHRTVQLTELGVASLAAAYQRQASAAEHIRTAERHETRRDTLAPKGLDTLRTDVARLDSEVGDFAEPTESIETLTARRDATRESRNSAEAAQMAAQAALAETDRALVARETNLRRSREALDRETAALDDNAEPTEARRTLNDALTAKRTTLDIAQRDAAGLRESAPDLASLSAIQQRAASVLSRTREEADTLERTISELNGSIGARADEGVEEDLAATEGRRTRAAERVAEIETEIATLTRLRDVLMAAKADAKEHFFEPVVKELKPLLEIVFGDAKVTFDETTLLPVSLERAGEVESFDVLSGGMREQITILTRLAFARLLAQDGRTVPVILDDALIYSDDDRIERMFNALHRQAMDLQILVFTCRQRAFHQLGGRALTMQDWSPEA